MRSTERSPARLAARFAIAVVSSRLVQANEVDDRRDLLGGRVERVERGAEGTLEPRRSPAAPRASRRSARGAACNSRSAGPESVIRPHSVGVSNGAAGSSASSDGFASESVPPRMIERGPELRVERRQRVDGRRQGGVARGRRRQDLIAGRDQRLQVRRSLAQRREHGRARPSSRWTLPCSPSSTPTIASRSPSAGSRFPNALLSPRRARRARSRCRTETPGGPAGWACRTLPGPGRAAGSSRPATAGSCRRPPASARSRSPQRARHTPLRAASSDAGSRACSAGSVRTAARRRSSHSEFTPRCGPRSRARR